MVGNAAVADGADVLDGTANCNFNGRHQTSAMEVVGVLQEESLTNWRRKKRVVRFSAAGIKKEEG